MSDVNQLYLLYNYTNQSEHQKLRCKYKILIYIIHLNSSYKWLPVPGHKASYALQDQFS